MANRESHLWVFLHIILNKVTFLQISPNLVIFSIRNHA